MRESIMSRGFPWGEPAHPGVIRYYEGLISIYKVVRSELQHGVDDAFDGVSRQIGFVVTTTVPVVLHISDDHKAAQWRIADSLKGSLFEGKLMEAVGKGGGESFQSVAPGQYTLYLLWYDGLKLKLRKDWLEPVHVVAGAVGEAVLEAAAVRPEVQEPAHWFIPGERLSVDEKVVISAIDEVYPELRLADRIAATRQLARVRPEVMEPAHPGLADAPAALREISQLIRRVTPGVMEPAHFRMSERDLVADIAQVLRKYGA